MVGKMLLGIASLWTCVVCAETPLRDCGDFLSKTYHVLNRHIAYHPLSSPLIAYTETHSGKRRQKVELADIVSVDDPEVQRILDYVHERGGKVRLMKARVFDIRSNAIRWEHEEPYFWVNLKAASPSFMIPVIGIDLTIPGALTALAHEFEHFKVWWDEYQKALLVNPDPETATRAAVDRIWEVEMIAYGERLAVNAEMRVERDFPDHQFNRPQSVPRPNSFWQPHFVNRVTYPEFQAVRILLKKDRDGLLARYIGQMLDTAADIRDKALAYLPPADESLPFWQNASALDLLIRPFGADRLARDQTLDLFNKTARRLCLERTQDAQFCR